MSGLTKLGGCLCGDVRYEIRGVLRDSIACHCKQCRKTSGHYVSATAVAKADFHILEDRGLRWYQSSDTARRGFCQNCGSSLFWDQDGRDQMGIMSGTIDGDTGIKTREHIFVEDKGDYYELGDGLPTYISYPGKVK
ncbi:GFA family protein [Kiloniella laminariae]|uniref:GFA family protein n=1 Tax=Kiloniella laminariae TaxID=454162 RepID=A0ABT4LJP3_9PROT|nr:GFA family protein [Kiloniella laminariae]MCZ4281323.1 GFA family protein [Kiloniella laminariae]